MISCNQVDNISDSINKTNRVPTSSESTTKRWTGSVSSSYFPFNLEISSSFSSEEQTEIENMMNEWDSNISEIDIFTSPVNTIANFTPSSLGDYNDTTFGIYKAQDWHSSLSSSALAVTQYFGIRRNTGTSSEFIDMLHADIIINYEHFDFSTDSTFGTYDLPSVVLHELGHFIGLSHHYSFTPASVMYPTLTMFDYERLVYQHDIDAVLDLYVNSSAPAIVSSSGSSTSPLVKSSIRDSNNDSDGEVIRGVFELRPGGQCRHIENGVVKKVHFIKN